MKAVTNEYTLDKAGTSYAAVKTEGLQDVINTGDITIEGRVYKLSNTYFIANPNVKPDIGCTESFR